MPTILREDGYRFFFFSNEGSEPPHVHVEKGGGYAKLRLRPVRFAYSRGFVQAQRRRVLDIVKWNEGMFLERRHGFFGG